MDGSDSIGVYGEAKAEYTRQLSSFLVPALETYFLDLLATVKETEKDPKRVLWVFQDSLKEFPDWNMDKVQRETEKVSTATKCDYLEEILTAVFIAHTKVLSAIRLTSKQKKLQITIPKLEHFLHRTMSECARHLWSNAYLFSESGTSIERQKNLRSVEQLLHEAVLQSIRGMLPVKSILKEYLADDGDDDAADVVAPPSTPAPAAETEIHESAPEPVVAPAPEPVAAPAPEPVAAPAPEPVAAPAPEPVVAPAPEPVAIEVPVVPGSIAVPPTPTIVVDTEPAVVSFTELDTVFDHENPERNSIQFSEAREDTDYVDGIEIDDTAAPESVDGFETFEDEENEEKTLAVGEDEFERL
jgi:hypothetical protein